MNKNRLLFFTSIIVLIMLLGVFTIGSAQEVKTVKIGVSVADQSNPFYIEILDGMESALKDGDKLIVMDAAFDLAKQISDIEDMVQQEVDVMMIDPVDSKGIQAALVICEEAGIPVISYNSPVEDTSMVVSNVATDNFMAGQLIGEALTTDRKSVV